MARNNYFLAFDITIQYDRDETQAI